MSENGPDILVVDDDRDERTMIASLLREAGFDVAAMAPDDTASTATNGRRFAAAVIALPGGDGMAVLRRVQRRHPGLKGLIVVEPAAMRLVDDDGAALIKRPFDPRQLLGCVFALALREDEPGDTPGSGQDAAEFGIAAAKLVCLRNRRVAAAAVGASRLAQELSRQISETAALHSGLTVVP